jgi:hypothetical protein
LELTVSVFGSRLSYLLLAGAVLVSPALALAQAVEEPGSTVGRALQQPFRDLNLVRTHTAPVLQQAMANPYDTAGLNDCATVGARIAELESVLGPDIDTPGRKGPGAGSQLAAGAVSNIVDLPFGGVIRHLTGAYAQDLAHRKAVLAGMVRRGYLTGVWRTMGCAAPAPVAQVAAPVPTAARAPEPVMPPVEPHAVSPEAATPTFDPSQFASAPPPDAP